MAELLGRMTSRELAEWEAYFRIEPTGGAADDWRFGVLACLLSSGSRQPQDFFPAARGPERPADPEAMFARLCAATRGL